MLEDIRGVIQEETQQFLDELIARAEYPIAQTLCASGELSARILDICQNQEVDLVICGNHNHSFFSRAACCAKTIVSNSKVDVLLIPLSAV